jgi:hypothetical protein
MSWPPPPDLESLKELFASADVEGLIADDCPLDEYDPEAKHFFEEISGWSSSRFTTEEITPVLVDIFAKQFGWNRGSEATHEGKVAGLAAQIARFFGPEAKPLVRGQA